MPAEADAIVVGSGPNGLAAAATLAAAGLAVLVIEGAHTPGGGCRTEQLTLPGFWHDVCASAHPMAVASPFFRAFDLAARGVRFAHPPVAFAHPLDGGRAAVVTRSVAETAARLGADAAAYRRLMEPLVRGAEALTEAVLSSMRRPPGRYDAALLAFARRGLGSAAGLARRLETAPGRALFAGAAAHAMRPLNTPLTAAFGLLLTALAHAAGWPVVEGGSAQLARAMMEAVEAAGGQVETGRWVSSLGELPSTRAVLLDVSPRTLLALGGEALPAGYREALARYRYGPGVCKVDFALAGPAPWANEDCRRAGTLHLGGTFAEVAAAERAVARGRHPDAPYVLAIQAGVADATRAPEGGHTLWTYCHVPAGSDVDMSGRIQAQIERFAPGFADLVLARHVRTAADEEAFNPNYVGGDIGAGSQTPRQLLARPAARWNPYRTPLPGVYLCSAATPPGPGVHGRCGQLAALTVLRDRFGVRRPPPLSPPAAAG